MVPCGPPQYQQGGAPITPRSLSLGKGHAQPSMLLPIILPIVTYAHICSVCDNKEENPHKNCMQVLEADRHTTVKPLCKTAQNMRQSEEESWIRGYIFRRYEKTFEKAGGRRLTIGRGEARWGLNSVTCVRMSLPEDILEAKPFIGYFHKTLTDTQLHGYANDTTRHFESRHIVPLT